MLALRSASRRTAALAASAASSALSPGAGAAASAVGRTAAGVGASSSGSAAGASSSVLARVQARGFAAGAHGEGVRLHDGAVGKREREREREREGGRCALRGSGLMERP